MPVELSEAVAVLRRTPATLRSLLQGLDEPWLTADEGPDTFSPRDVLGHLITGDETDWMPRARIILEEGEARAFTPWDRFAFKTRFGDWTTDALLDRFAELRKENLEGLASLRLTPGDFEKRGTHPELGTVTLGQLLATWVAHDLGHLAQVARVMARRYRDTVGPWRAYLSLLRH